MADFSQLSISLYVDKYAFNEVFWPFISLQCYTFRLSYTAYELRSNETSDLVCFLSKRPPMTIWWFSW